MSGARGGRSRAGRDQGVVLFFGEDHNDRASLREIVLGLRRDVRRRDTGLRRKPLTLVKNLDEAKRRSRSSAVTKLLQAETRKGPLRAAIFHEDTDAIEPSHIALAELIKQTYDGAPCKIVPAVAAYELESWWFLFPEAVSEVNGQWRLPNQYVGRKIGLVPETKEKLRKCVRPDGVRRGPRFKEYEESDSLKIAENIVALRLLDRTPVAESESWNVFLAEVKTL